MRNNYKISYAQNREDIILSGFFKDVEKGFYVDIGANHPINDSVTKLFYESGWSGINVEPSPNLHELLSQDRPRDINLNVGVSDKEGTLELREYTNGNGLSTFSEDMKKGYANDPNSFTKNYKDYEVRVRPLRDIFKEQQVAQINFMKVDVEGYEYEVLDSNDWNKYRPQVICIEANHILKDWRPLIISNGYTLKFFDGLNEYYVANEVQKLADSFSYVNTMLPKPIISKNLYNQFADGEWQLQQLQLKLSRLELANKQLEIKAHQLHEQINQSKRIRSLVKQLIRSVDGAILYQIAKLDRPPIHKKSISISLPAEAQEAKVILRLYDFDYYYSNRTHQRYSYSIILVSYKVPTRFFGRILKQSVAKVRGKK